VKEGRLIYHRGCTGVVARRGDGLGTAVKGDGGERNDDVMLWLERM
jgi:hypothetical protein